MLQETMGAGEEEPVIITPFKAYCETRWLARYKEIRPGPGVEIEQKE